MCKGMRADFDPVRQYMHELNLDLNKYMTTMSKEDVNEIVPMSYLQNNDAFFEYMCVSNDKYVILYIRITHPCKSHALTPQF